MKTIQQIERERHTYPNPWDGCPRVYIRRNTTCYGYRAIFREAMSFMLVLGFIALMAFVSVAFGG